MSEERRIKDRRVSPAIGEFALEERGELLARIAALEADRDRIKIIADNYSALNMDAQVELAALKEQQRGGVVPGSVIPDRDGLVAAACVLRSQGLGNLADSVSDALTALDGARLNPPGKFRIGDPVRKIRGSQWSGSVVGTYSTELTPEGYAVESFTEKGSVQIYPAAALEACEEPVECVAVPRELLADLISLDREKRIPAERHLYALLAQQGKERKNEH